DHPGARVHECAQGLGQTDQQEFRIGMLFEKIPACRQRDTGAMVAPHAINRQGDHGQRTPSAWRFWAERPKAGSIKTKARCYSNRSPGPPCGNAIRLRTWA